MSRTGAPASGPQFLQIAPDQQPPLNTRGLFWSADSLLPLFNRKSRRAIAKPPLSQSKARDNASLVLECGQLASAFNRRSLRAIAKYRQATHSQFADHLPLLLNRPKAKPIYAASNNGRMRLAHTWRRCDAHGFDRCWVRAECCPCSAWWWAGGGSPPKGNTAPI